MTPEEVLKRYNEQMRAERRGNAYIIDMQVVEDFFNKKNQSESHPVHQRLLAITNEICEELSTRSLSKQRRMGKLRKK